MRDQRRITGSTTDEQSARRVGASACYLKPIDMDALCATVADLCERPLTHVERGSLRHPRVREAAFGP